MSSKNEEGRLKTSSQILEKRGSDEGHGKHIIYYDHGPSANQKESKFTSHNQGRRRSITGNNNDGAKEHTKMSMKERETVARRQKTLNMGRERSAMVSNHRLSDRQLGSFLGTDNQRYSAFQDTEDTHKILQDMGIPLEEKTATTSAQQGSPIDPYKIVYDETLTYIGDVKEMELCMISGTPGAEDGFFELLELGSSGNKPNPVTGLPNPSIKTRNGKGVLLYSEDKSIWMGTWQADVMVGEGKISLFSGKIRYHGDVYDMKREGMGRLVIRGDEPNSPFLLKYEGNFKDNLFDGKGRMLKPKHPLYSYEGNFMNGYFDGDGFEIDEFGNTYTGNFVKGEKNGEGKLTLVEQGARYAGQFKNDMFHGNGAFYFKDGTVYQGDFLNNQITGMGKKKYAQRNNEGEVYILKSYEGEFLNGMMHGFGILHYRNGDVYTGELIEDRKEGQGRMVYADGSKYEGTWSDDARNGKGNLLVNGGNKYRGIWAGNSYLVKGDIKHTNGEIETVSNRDCAVVDGGLSNRSLSPSRILNLQVVGTEMTGKQANNKSGMTIDDRWCC